MLKLLLINTAANTGSTGSIAKYEGSESWFGYDREK